MGYKLVIRENNIDEGALEDYYNQLARQQGIKSHRRLNLPDPSSSGVSAQDKIKALQTKIDTAKQKSASQAADSAKNLEKEKTKQKNDLVRQEIQFLNEITRDLRNATKLDDSVLRGALENITKNYIGKVNLDESTAIEPLAQPSGAKIFKKYYPATINPAIFTHFENIEQIVNFIDIYSSRLKNAQEYISTELAPGFKIKVDVRLLRVFELNTKYVEHLTNPTPAISISPPVKKRTRKKTT